MPEMPEPPSKRQKTEENLIPEDMFLMRNKGPVTFNVSVVLYSFEACNICLVNLAPILAYRNSPVPRSWFP